jgi:hypothetical protein
MLGVACGLVCHAIRLSMDAPDFRGSAAGELDADPMVPTLRRLARRLLEIA